MDWGRGSYVSHWVKSDGWQTGSDKVPQDCVMLHHIMLSHVILSHVAVARTGCGFSVVQCGLVQLRASSRVQLRPALRSFHPLFCTSHGRAYDDGPNGAVPLKTTGAVESLRWSPSLLMLAGWCSTLEVLHRHPYQCRRCTEVKR